MGIGGWLTNAQSRFFKALYGRPRPAEKSGEQRAAVEAPPAAEPEPQAAPAQPQPEPPPVQARAEPPAPPVVVSTPPESLSQATMLDTSRYPGPALVVQDGGLAGQRFPVDATVTLGRENADLVIDDPEISRPHARMEWKQERLEVSDLGSSNGTFVNGERIEGPRELRNGDLVKLGQTSLTIEIPPPRDPGATVISPR